MKDNINSNNKLSQNLNRNKSFQELKLIKKILSDFPIFKSQEQNYKRVYPNKN
jgi:hypothetical protein